MIANSQDLTSVGEGALVPGRVPGVRLVGRGSLQLHGAVRTLRTPVLDINISPFNKQTRMGVYIYILYLVGSQISFCTKIMALYHICYEVCNLCGFQIKYLFCGHFQRFLRVVDILNNLYDLIQLRLFNFIIIVSFTLLLFQLLYSFQHSQTTNVFFVNI